MGLLAFGVAILELQREFNKVKADGSSDAIRDFALSVLACGDEQAKEGSCGCLGSEPTEAVRVIVEGLA